MKPEYPDLYFLDDFFQEKIDDMFSEKGNIVARMFTQTWPNTARGFSEPGCVSGQAFTDQYTTILYDKTHRVAMIAFNDEPAYLVKDAWKNRTFMSDYNLDQMKNLGDAITYYNAIKL